MDTAALSWWKVALRLFVFSRKTSVYAKSLQPHSRGASVREHDIQGRERGKGKYCTAPQYCGYSVETHDSFGSFIQLFKARGKRKKKK